MLKNNTFSINYKKADSDFSNSKLLKVDIRLTDNVCSANKEYQ